ncbi:C-GCAxxG-C-C family protein [Labilibaculum sp.]|uniref:C-GCAxxG-C-C family protein n=1 Tax=Labilibaculum sp. TaxID=2060723 RepID=UPI00356711D2
MKEIEEKAIHSFYNGMNCSQSVVTAYADHLKFDPDMALSVSTGFGGGMGKLQSSCGAVTGSFMVLGIYNSKKHPDNMDARSATNEMIKSFTLYFKALHGSIDCKTILNCDFNTVEGEKEFENKDLKKNVCAKCISDSVKLVNLLLEE